MNKRPSSMRDFKVWSLVLRCMALQLESPIDSVQRLETPLK